jgi:quercetin dioxygenase-like cupin family protein
MAATVNSCIVSREQGPVWDMEPGRPTTFKLMSGQTGGNISVFQEIVPVGAGTPFHIHHTSDELIHVVSGELTIKLGIPVTTIGAGAWVFIPRGLTHGWRNSGKAPAEVAFLFTPSDGAMLYEELRLLGQPLPNIDPKTLEMLGKQHGFELVSFDWE